MVTVPRTFQNQAIYHIVNRGVEKRTIFQDRIDFRRFIRALVFYQQVERSTKLSLSKFRLVDRHSPFRFEVLAYCLMPNHFHLLVRQLVDGGISQGISEICNSYTKFFNTRYTRVGPLFQGTFRAVRIETDDVLVHVCRYIFLNPVVASLAAAPGDYQWSSYRTIQSGDEFTAPSTFLDYFTDFKQFETFVIDHLDYARSLESIKHLAID